MIAWEQLRARELVVATLPWPRQGSTSEETLLHWRSIRKFGWTSQSSKCACRSAWLPLMTLRCARLGATAAKLACGTRESESARGCRLFLSTDSLFGSPFVGEAGVLWGRSADEESSHFMDQAHDPGGFCAAGDLLTTTSATGTYKNACVKSPQELDRTTRALVAEPIESWSLHLRSSRGAHVFDAYLFAQTGQVSWFCGELKPTGLWALFLICKVSAWNNC